jgi:molybdate transport system ATP-binding protein
MSLSVSLRHSLGGFKLNVAFDVPAGITVLFGPSGSGKTTVINMAAGLLQPDSGRVASGDWVLLDTARNIDLPTHSRRLGYIFQEGRLFPHLTVRQNLLYGQRFAPKTAPKEDLGRVVEMLGIGHLLPRRPNLLSGGEKQRVAIGRALLASPRLILADEPLSALDSAHKAEIMPYFERLRDEVSVPILYVSHSPAEVARLATTVVVLDNGKVTRQGSASDVMSDPMLAPLGIRAVGAVLEVLIVAHHDDGLTELDAMGQKLLLPLISQPIGSRLRIRIPAHDVILSRQRPEGLSALNVIEGVIERVRPGDGPGAIVSLNTPAGTVLARITRRSAAALDLEPGIKCYAIAKTIAVAPEDIGTTPFES